METRENILMYAGYSAYITGNALKEAGYPESSLVRISGDSCNLTAEKCRWLVREFNIRSDEDGFIHKRWLRLESKLQSHLNVKVKDFFRIEWDSAAVLRYYREIEETRRLLGLFTDAVKLCDIDLDEVGRPYGKTGSKMWEVLRYGIWVPEDLLKAIRKSLPADEGFYGRFQISIGAGE